MIKNEKIQINDIIDRLSRISAAEHWVGGLNPAQFAALSYLAKANQYSRAPSQIAEFLSAMRGTTSATLKALARKGLIEEEKSKVDLRRTSYNITKPGLDALEFDTAIDVAICGMSDKQARKIESKLKDLVKNILAARGDRSFGVCNTCKHNIENTNGTYCALLEISLKKAEPNQICFEHQFAA